MASLFLLTLIILQLINITHSTTHWKDIQVLKQIKNTIQPNTIPQGSCIDSWDFTLDPCDNLFKEKFTCGFRCDYVYESSNRVTELALDSAGYSGNLSSVSWDLPFLQNLDFSNNNFTGPLPESFSNLSKLQRLVLSRNSLSGPVPDSIGTLSNLQEMYLDNNMLTGTFPTFNGLKILKRLEIQGNKFSSELPDLSQLESLSFLDASDNSFTGNLPANFPPNVIEIVARNNQLEGNVQWSIGRFSYLQVLDLSHNRLTGSVPASLFTHPSLEQLTLSNNQFGSVEMPSDLGLGSQLISIDLSNNDIHGFLPGFMGSMPRLLALSLENNKFTGLIPPQYALKFLGKGIVEPFERLLLGGNYVFGPIPDPFMDLKAGSVMVRLGDNCLYRCPLRLFICGGGVQKSLMECRAFGPIIP